MSTLFCRRLDISLLYKLLSRTCFSVQIYINIMMVAIIKKEYENNFSKIESFKGNKERNKVAYMFMCILGRY